VISGFAGGLSWARCWVLLLMDKCWVSATSCACCGTGKATVAGSEYDDCGW
jgi:hypothetical protein